MERFADALRGLVRGDEVAYDETTAQFPWANGYEMPVWIAAYGPKALAGAGRSGDGLVIQLADPGLVKWFSQQAISAGKAVRQGHVQVMALCRRRRFGSAIWTKRANKRAGSRPMVGNHVADIVERYGMDSPDIPASLTTYIEGTQGL